MQQVEVDYDHLYSRVAPGEAELRVMEDTPSSRMLLDVFFGSYEGNQVIRNRLEERRMKKGKGKGKGKARGE